MVSKNKALRFLISLFSKMFWYSTNGTNPKTITKERTWTCIDKAKCLLSQNCLINNIIYKAVLPSTSPG